MSQSTMAGKSSGWFSMFRIIYGRSLIGSEPWTPNPEGVGSNPTVRAKRRSSAGGQFATD